MLDQGRRSGREPIVAAQQRAVDARQPPHALGRRRAAQEREPAGERIDACGKTGCRDPDGEDLVRVATLKSEHALAVFDPIGQRVEHAGADQALEGDVGGFLDLAG